MRRSVGSPGLTPNGSQSQASPTPSPSPSGAGGQPRTSTAAITGSPSTDEDAAHLSAMKRMPSTVTSAGSPKSSRSTGRPSMTAPMQADSPLSMNASAG